MFLVDKALEKRDRKGNPIRVAMVGAGFMGRGIALQMAKDKPGIRLVAIANRRLTGAERAYCEAGAGNFRVVETVAQLEDAIKHCQYAMEGEIVERGTLEELLARHGYYDDLYESCKLLFSYRLQDKLLHTLARAMRKARRARSLLFRGHELERSCAR
jgi:shikimate 5-dehydrogenase